MDNNCLTKDELQLGMIKSYNDEKKYGFIETVVNYRIQDVFFHICNSYIKKPLPQKIVAFRVKRNKKNNKYEAYDINTLYVHAKELWASRNEYHFNNLFILAYVDDVIMNEIIYTKYIKQLQKIRTNLYHYVETYDIQAAINSYSVRVKKSHIYKPGDDDSATVFYYADRNSGIYLSSDINLRDMYIDSILPTINKTIFHDSGFCPWQEMMEDFGSLDEYEENACVMTSQNRCNASNSYNKDEHFKYLDLFLSNKINDIVLKNRKDIEEYVKKDIVGYKSCQECDILKCNIENYI